MLLRVMRIFRSVFASCNYLPCPRVYFQGFPCSQWLKSPGLECILDCVDTRFSTKNAVFNPVEVVNSYRKFSSEPPRVSCVPCLRQLPAKSEKIRASPEFRRFGVTSCGK